VNKRRWLLLAVTAAGIVAVTPSYIRAYRVDGTSDAPSFLTGDRILLLKAAYDIRLPYADLVLMSRSEPKPGDVVMYRLPGQNYPVFKRVIGCPGDMVAMRSNHLEINGTLMGYEDVDPAAFQPVAEANNLGSIIEIESGHGPPHLITHSPGAGTYATFDAVQVPAGHYFVIGDNRDNSLDSRMYGPIPRDSIIGRVASKKAVQ
jgi:signal peptidase I